MTAAERTLLLALFRWARDEGVRRDGAMRWTSPPPHRWGVDYWPGADGRSLHVWRTEMYGTNYLVTSVVEAVDVLAALGIVPARLSSAYAAGWNACVGIMRIPGAVIRTVTPPGDEGEDCDCRTDESSLNRAKFHRQGCHGAVI